MHTPCCGLCILSMWCISCCPTEEGAIVFGLSRVPKFRFCACPLWSCFVPTLTCGLNKLGSVYTGFMREHCALLNGCVYAFVWFGFWYNCNLFKNFCTLNFVSNFVFKADFAAVSAKQFTVRDVCTSESPCTCNEIPCNDAHSSCETRVPVIWWWENIEWIHIFKMQDTVRLQEQMERGRNTCVCLHSM